MFTTLNFSLGETADMILETVEGFAQKEIAPIAAKIDEENVGLHFDTFHSHIEEKDIYGALIKGGKNINHVHFCENTRGVPGTGQVNWTDVVRG